MTRKRSCDDHPKYVSGCAGCNARSRVYESRRWFLAQQGIRLSTDATPVTQRLRELRALGYRLRDLEEHTGIHFKQLYRLCCGTTKWVQWRTFEAVEAAYTELSRSPGPSRQSAAMARSRGWRPPPQHEPISVMDEVAIDRAVHGDRRVTLTRLEMAEAVRQLLEHHTQREAARILGISERRIHRIVHGVTARPYGRSA